MNSSNLFVLVDLPKYAYNIILNDLLESNMLSIETELEDEDNVQNKNFIQISNSNTFVDPPLKSLLEWLFIQMFVLEKIVGLDPIL